MGHYDEFYEADERRKREELNKRVAAILTDLRSVVLRIKSIHGSHAAALAATYAETASLWLKEV